MAGPCGFMRLEGGMPGLCTKNIGKMLFFLSHKISLKDFLGIRFHIS